MRVDEQGIHLRQSDITAFVACPEQYRRTNFDPSLSRVESDAALVGTALHALIQQELTEGFFDTMGEAEDYTQHFFQYNVYSFDLQGVPYNRESFGTDAKAMVLLDGLVGDWWHSDERRYLAENPGRQNVEMEFDVPFTQADDGTPIFLTGTSDIIIPDLNMVWDWKTAGRGYELWEKQRWAIQPTVYLYAAKHLGLVLPNRMGEYVFEYKVFLRSTKDRVAPAETYRVFRTEGSFDWLENMVQRLMRMQIVMGPDVGWPVNDHGWHCSPKWCSAFATCKGEHVNTESNWT